MQTIYKVSNWCGPKSSGNHYKTPIIDLRHFADEQKAREYLNEMRRNYRKGRDYHITTEGADYFTFTYDWPISNTELRHTYAIIPINVE